MRNRYSLVYTQTVARIDARSRLPEPQIPLPVRACARGERGAGAHAWRSALRYDRLRRPGGLSAPSAEDSFRPAPRQREGAPEGNAG